MIQRVQTIYLALCLLCLTLLTTGMNLVSFSNEESKFDVSMLKISEYQDEALIKSKFYFGAGILAVLILSTIVTLLSYKNLKRQLKLCRSLTFTYLACMIGFILWSYLGNSSIAEGINTRSNGIGFLFFVAGFPFTFLANIGIKRDKTLLDSLDRLR